MGMANVTEWVHEIDSKDDIRTLNPTFNRPTEWFAMLERQKPSWGERTDITFAQLQQLNKDINHSFKWTLTDINYTATPSEIKKRGYGDCKAAVTLKYYALAKLGMKPWEMNVYEGYYIKNQTTPGAHRTLVVALNGKFWSMDLDNDDIVEAKDFMNIDFMPKHRLDNKRVSIW